MAETIASKLAKRIHTDGATHFKAASAPSAAVTGDIWYFKIFSKIILWIPRFKKLLMNYLPVDISDFIKEFNEQTDKFDIQGSSYNGIASANNVIGNWWSHKILQTDSQISPVSGSIKEQVVTFIAKEKIELYGKTYDVDHFKLTSKDMSLPKDKRLNFDI